MFIGRETELKRLEKMYSVTSLNSQQSMVEEGAERQH